MQNLQDLILKKKISGIRDIAVLFGGISAERRVSCASAKLVIQAITELGYTVQPLDCGANIGAQIAQLQTDMVFNILHGGAGEDGTVAGLLDAFDLPYCASAMAASALTMDKYTCKTLLASVGIPVTKGVLLRKQDGLSPAQLEAQCQQDIGALPWFVKPNNSGSSLGTAPLANSTAFHTAIPALLQQYGEILVEEQIIGEEYTIGIVADTALPVVHIRTASGLYDYAAKYTSTATVLELPSQLDAADERYIQQLSSKAFSITRCSIWGRVDCMRTADGKWFVLEINTIPGMTDHSLVPAAAQYAGISYPQLIHLLLWFGWQRSHG